MKKLIVSLLATAAFANAGWKKDADGKIEVDAAGNPIWIDANGGERAMNGDTITTLNAEAKTLRTAKEAAEAKLKDFEGLDPTVARKAVDDIKKIDSKKLIDAGEVDKVRKEISDQFTAQLAEKDKALQGVQSAYDAERINNLFAASDFIRDKVAMPRDFFEAAFKQNFKIEDGKVVAYDKSGNRLLSEKNAGDYADPQEAIELLVMKHPQKDAILKADIGTGTGNNGNGGNRGGKPSMARSEFEKLPPVKQAELAQKMGAGEFNIVD